MIELGGQWVGAMQERFHALIEEMGFKTSPSPVDGDQLIRGIYTKRFVRVAPQTWDTLPEFRPVRALLQRIQQMADTIDAENPWLHIKAAEWDRITFAQWLDEHVSNRNAARLVQALLSSVPCASAAEISMLHLLWLVKACNGLESLFKTKGGAQQDRIIGGAQAVAQRLAERLGDAVLFDEPVVRIEWSKSDAVVFTDTLSIKAEHVIIAVPPALAGVIEYSPALPTSRAQVTQRWPQGAIIKVHAAYNDAFWRKEGLVGESLDYASPVLDTYDCGQAVLAAFVYGDRALSLARMGAQRRRAVLLQALSKRFGREALHPMDYLETNWAEEKWSLGGFGGFLIPGATSRFQSSTRKAVEVLHWAGTETSTEWVTFIEGAICSGERAARECLRKL